METPGTNDNPQQIQNYIARAVAKGYPAEIFSGSRSEDDIVAAMGTHMKNEYLALNYPASVFDSCTTPVEVKNAALAYREALIQERAEAEQKRLAHAATLARRTVEQERLAAGANTVLAAPALHHTVSTASEAVQQENEPGARYRKVKVDWLGINQEKVVGTYAILFFLIVFIYGMDFFVKFDGHTLNLLQVPVWVCVVGTSAFVLYKLAFPTYTTIQTHKPKMAPAAPAPIPVPPQEPKAVVEEPPAVTHTLPEEPPPKTADELLKELENEIAISKAKAELARAEKRLADETAMPQKISLDAGIEKIRKSVKKIDEITAQAKAENWTDAELKAVKGLIEDDRANTVNSLNNQS
jgi:hypothetical protein